MCLFAWPEGLDGQVAPHRGLKFGPTQIWTELAQKMDVPGEGAVGDGLTDQNGEFNIWCQDETFAW
jgi:hypothetical protein